MITNDPERPLSKEEVLNIGRMQAAKFRRRLRDVELNNDSIDPLMHAGECYELVANAIELMAGLVKRIDPKL